MNYELCKKLKDAGFPQQKFGYGTSHHHKQGDVCYIPTLSELIEACGERGMFALTREQGEDCWVWTATTPHLTARELVSGTGSTPEEAVAKLWLTLNEK